MPSISVLCHLYYEDSLSLLKPYLDNLAPYAPSYYFNLCNDTEYVIELTELILSIYPSATITVSPNVGKDIGGKLVLLDTYLKMEKKDEFLVLLHDKISPHTSTGNTWREKLLTILKKNTIENILQEFTNNKWVGLIAQKDFIMNEFDEANLNYACTSNEILQNLRSKYRLTQQQHDFVGGTMFWVRSEIFTHFFSCNKPLTIRATLEKGNVLDHQNGSFSHAWERMFSWIVSEQGYLIKGM